jgi:hypothetical protein
MSRPNWSTLQVEISQDTSETAKLEQHRGSPEQEAVDAPIPGSDF